MYKSFNFERLFMARRVLLAGVAFIILGAASSFAATISLSIVYPDATDWQIYATDASGNAGIYSVGADITGASSIGSVDQSDSGFEAPVAVFQKSTTVKQFGFTNQLAGPQADNGNLGGLLQTVTVAQGLSDPAGDYFYGVGQGTVSSGSLTPPSGMTSANLVGGPVSYPSPILLLQGTMPSGGQITLGGLNGFTFNTSGTGAGLTFRLQPWAWFRSLLRSLCWPWAVWVSRPSPVAAPNFGELLNDITCSNPRAPREAGVPFFVGAYANL